MFEFEKHLEELNVRINTSESEYSSSLIGNNLSIYLGKKLVGVVDKDLGVNIIKESYREKVFELIN